LKFKIKSKTFREGMGFLAYRVFLRLLNLGRSHFDSNGELWSLISVFRGLNLNNICIFDVGVNKGLFIDKTIELAEKEELEVSIHGFEPLKFLFDDLQEKYRSSPFVNLNNFGCGNIKKNLPLFVNRQNHTLSSLSKRDLSFHGLELDEEIEVGIIRLEDYCRENRVEHIHLLKIDVEGHEFDVLRGLGQLLSPDFISVIQFEYGGANLDSRVLLKDLLDLLESRGFRVLKVMKNYYLDFKYNTVWENFQNSNFIAIRKSA